MENDAFLLFCTQSIALKNLAAGLNCFCHHGHIYQEGLMKDGMNLKRQTNRQRNKWRFLQSKQKKAECR